jgi:hypothetical protein
VRSLRPFVLLAGLAVLAAPIAAALLLRPGSNAQASVAPAAAAPAATVPAPSGPRFPAPPAGAVVYSRELGSNALALGVVPQAGQVLAQASVVGPQGTGVSGLDVAFRMQGATKTATACGAGCYRATLATTGKPASVDVILSGRDAVRWHVALPAQWPAPDGSALLARVGAVWRSLRSLSYSETLSSGPGHTVLSTWQAVAPDRIAYQVKDGWDGIVVGETRWDKAPGAKRWVSSPQTRLTQPVPSWVEVTDAHVLGSTTVRGRPAWRISFFDPQTPGWYTVLVDKASLRSYQVRMTATSHFMQDDYGAFNATSPILPPR